MPWEREGLGGYITQNPHTWKGAGKPLPDSPAEIPPEIPPLLCHIDKIVSIGDGKMTTWPADGQNKAILDGLDTRSKTGEPGAVVELWEAVRRFVELKARDRARVPGCRAQADDLIQSGFLAVLDTAARYEPEEGKKLPSRSGLLPAESVRGGRGGPEHPAGCVATCGQHRGGGIPG